MTVAEQERPAPAGRRPGLKREIGFIGLIWASTGSIIGSGWLFGAQEALPVAGPAAIISWVIGGIAIMILALVHAELGGMYPVSGGTARFPHYAFGGVAGASFGWFSWLQAATVAPIEVLAMIQYGQHYSFAHGFMKVVAGENILTPSGIVVAVILMAILTTINMLSVKRLATTNSVATWWKVAIPFATIFILAIANFNSSNFTAADGFDPYGLHGILLAVSTSGIIFALLGFEQADQLAGESANPRRDIPRAVIGSVAIGIVIYVALQVVFLAALNPGQFGNTWSDPHSAFLAFGGPFADIAMAVGVGWLAAILYLDAIISPGGTGLIYTAGSSRVAYGLSRNGYVPSIFERTNNNSVPWVGLLAAFITGCVCFLPFPSWQSLVGLITSASVLMYAGAPLAFAVFRKRLPNAHRPWRLPAGDVMAPLAFIVANFIILWSTWDVVWKLGLAILIGYVILIANQVFNWNPVQPHLQWRAASWLPVYLVGMGFIVWISDYGNFAQPWLPLGWDMLAVAVFALIIYFWARNVGLTTEEIEEMVEEYIAPEEEGVG